MDIWSAVMFLFGLGLGLVSGWVFGVLGRPDMAKKQRKNEEIEEEE